MKRRSIIATLLLALGLASFWWQAGGNSVAQDGSLPLCPSGIGITKPFNGETASEVIVLEATAPVSYGVQAVDFLVDGNLLYGGQPAQPYWRAHLDTRGSAVGNGQHGVFARMHMSGTANNTTAPYVCRTPAVSFNVNNPVTAPAVQKSLEVQPSLTSWSGPTNVAFEVVMKVVLVSGTTRTDISQQAAYEWTTTRGVISPKGYRASVNSGPSAGEGSITVRVRYGNLARDITIPLRVQPASESASYPTAAGQGGTATADSNPADRPKTVAGSTQDGVFQTALSRNGQGDAELERCLSSVLGQQEYQRRIRQQPRLAYAELARSEQCFLRRSSVVPANLAPVDPDKVASLPVRPDIKLQKFEKVAHNGEEAIRIAGRAGAGQTVVIYIFSEPLVLAAKADADGNWSYVLEDPMEPGEHQAYVTVEGDNSQPVRSEGFGFAIAAAPRTNLNPLGLSFAVQTTSKSGLFLWVYGLAAGVVVGLALVASILLWRRHGRRPPASSPNPPPAGA